MPGFIEATSFHKTAMPPVELFATWIQDMHRAGYRGQWVKIPVVDSGVDLTDSATKAAYIGGVNLVPGGDPADVQDVIGHGSLVTRIILTIAPEAQIYAARIFGAEGSCSDETLGAGLEKAAEVGDVTNVSVGGDKSIFALKGVAAHQSRRIPLVAAAGNSGDGSDKTSEREFPGGYPYCVTIGAVDRHFLADSGDEFRPLQPAYYSSSYPEVDGVAIGKVPGSWDVGTSFAAPVITGMLACYISWARATGRPTDDDASYAWLLANARQLPGMPARNDQTGYGLFTLRPWLGARIEIDTDTRQVYLNGQPCDLGTQAGLEIRPPGGIHGWLRPFLEAAGGRVGWDPNRKRSWYQF